MKAAIEIASPYGDQLIWSRQPAVAWWKIAGLLVATTLPTLFWVSALMLLAKSLGIMMSTFALSSIGFVVASISFVGAGLVMADAQQSAVPLHHLRATQLNPMPGCEN